jgi:alpha-D-xyloside xylohydrolase
MPVLARSGAVIPRREYAQSTAFIDKTRLLVDVYTGADGKFRLVEDDDRTEAYRDGKRRVTWLLYDDSKQELTVEAADGDYAGAPDFREITVTVISPSHSRTLAPRKVAVDRTERIRLVEVPATE